MEAHGHLCFVLLREIYESIEFVISSVFLMSFRIFSYVFVKYVPEICIYL